MFDQAAPDPYREFLAAKAAVAPVRGFAVRPEEVSPALKPHQRDMVIWACRLGRAALFASFGLGKSVTQLEILRLVHEREGGDCLIVCPLGVRQEFRRDAGLIGVEPKFIRRNEECDGDHWLYLTNYESVRDGRLDPRRFTAVSLDEAAVLRGFGGSLTFRTLMGLFEGSGSYRFVATATPSPNEYIELLAYAGFLGVMDIGQAKTRFFKRDSERADRLTLYPHKQQEFWLWVASWALFVDRPSDLGYSDEDYDLPPLKVHWHELPSDHKAAGAERDGQLRLLRNAAIGVQQASAEKRDSLNARIEKLLELRALDPGAHRLIWHDLEAERRAIEAAIPEAVTIYGSQDLDERERRVIDFSDGRIAELAAKPSLAGAGCNFQRHCAWAIFLGIGFKFHDFVQAVHRIKRFLQTKPVRIDLIYTEAEREIRRSLEAKWARHDELVGMMRRIVQEYGLTGAALSRAMSRSMEVERKEASGQRWTAINNDCVDEARRVASDSVDLIVTSVPFATQYEYTPSFRDFGHTDDNDHFWRQMDFLSPELLRVLRPGRVMAVHVKDRIVPGGLSGLGFQTLNPFHAEAIFHYRRHGFAFLGMKTITTDVVRENNQTYRLGWTEQCKDGSRMGCGVPEYVLLFRKPPSDLSDGYADVPVVKEKPLCDDHGVPAPFDPDSNWRHPVPGTGYSRARWQMDAHGYARSSGDRLISSAELAALIGGGVKREELHRQLYRMWRNRSADALYDFASHVAVAEELDHEGLLPSTFMLLPPHSWHPDVWTDVTRMRTLNALQYAKGRELHLCALQLDIVERLIVQLSMPGETVLDPFGGIMSVPYCAVKLGRKGIGIELAEDYWRDGIAHLKAAEAEAETPTLFALLEAPDQDEAA
ncbi:MAG TPA: DNA methyltransferase [Stellaceae bacterium]|nr:DNA methyltransferase [Stellaceae bacterium]